MTRQLKQVYRVSLVTGLALAFAYGVRLELPFLAPLFTFLLAISSEQPLKLKGMISLLLLVAITLGAGLLLIPVLEHYSFTGLLLVFLGIFMSTHITVNLGKVLVGTFFMVGMTLISIVGTQSFAVASTVVDTILISIICAVVCQWLVFPFFPIEPLEKTQAAQQPSAEGGDNIKEDNGKWVAMRTTAIVFPVYLLALTNPGMYLPLVMKAVSLGQQTSEMDVQKAGYELLLSTLVAGVLAIAFWVMLQFLPNLWIFFLLTVLFTMFVSRYLFAVSSSRFGPPYWQNVMITLLILLGPAVQDTINGDDVYKAFAVRISLFVAVSIYALYAARLLEGWRYARISRRVNRLA